MLSAAIANDFILIDPTTIDADKKISSKEALNVWINNFHLQMKNNHLWPIQVNLDTDINIIGKDNDIRYFTFKWSITSKKGELMLIKGTDFGTVNEQGQVTSINGFFDKI